MPAPLSTPTEIDSRDAILAVLALATAPAVGLGIARFAYALALPDMQAYFSWTYAEAGAPNALNALGYLIGAVGGARVAGMVGAMRLVVISTLVAAAATAASGLATGLVSLSILRLVAGVAAAFGLVAGGAVAIAVAERAGPRGSLAIACFYVGPPAGILVSALVTPIALGAEGVEGWRAAWAALGLASFMMTLAFLAPQLRRAAPPARRRAEGARAPLMRMAPVLLGYGAYGAGYIAYMTFMIAFLREEGATRWGEAAFWSTIGVAGIASAWIWSGAFTRLKGGFGVAAATVVTAVGAVAPLVLRGFSGQLVSGVVFGLGMFATVAATTVFVRRNLPSAAWASGVGAMTVAFSLGQTIGPVITGVVTDAAGGLGAGLAFGAGLLALGAFLSALQRDIDTMGVAPALAMPDDLPRDRR